ncbi:MAG TPA: hypothetical protein PKJ13_07600 [bacterium]|nr:hypothetical protein [bacterium]
MKSLGRCFILLILLGLTLVPIPALADKASEQKQRNADVATPDALVRAAYESISGPAGRNRNWDRMRNLWMGSARIILSSNNYEGDAIYEVMTLEGFIERVSDWYKQEGFYAREIASTTQRFGNIAQVWSTFEIRRGSSTSPVVYRGINSWSMVINKGRWWISQLNYDFESSRTPIPERYLKQP